MYCIPCAVPLRASRGARPRPAGERPAQGEAGGASPWSRQAAAARPGRAPFPGAGAQETSAGTTNEPPDVPECVQRVRRALWPRFPCAGAGGTGGASRRAGPPLPPRSAARQIAQVAQLTHLSRKAFRCRGGRETGQKCPSVGLDVPGYAQGAVRGSGARFAGASASKSTLESPCRSSAPVLGTKPGVVRVSTVACSDCSVRERAADGADRPVQGFCAAHSNRRCPRGHPAHLRLPVVNP